MSQPDHDNNLKICVERNKSHEQVQESQSVQI